jgi:hypothetical protein
MGRGSGRLLLLRRQAATRARLRAGLSHGSDPVGDARLLPEPSRVPGPAKLRQRRRLERWAPAAFGGYFAAAARNESVRGFAFVMEFPERW